MSIGSQVSTSRTNNSASVKKYRSTHRRIDYVPADDVLLIIERYHGKIDDTIAGTIDKLIEAGHKAIISGKAKL
ncbi:MAG TPA: hypothetical protein VMV91_14880 [Rhodocyclaceae bacterium]|nr:hypothetical protein [Rhodocyclaceae bacterium]